MFVAVVSTAAADLYTAYGSATAAFFTAFTSFLIGIMFILELSALAQYVSVVRHGISSEVYAAQKCFAHGLVQQFPFFVVDVLDFTQWMDARTPKYFVRIYVSDARHDCMIHHRLFYLAARTFHQCTLECLGGEVFVERLWSVGR